MKVSRGRAVIAALVTAAALGAPGAASAAVVLVSSSAPPEPNLVAIDPGETVTWLNAHDTNPVDVNAPGIGAFTLQPQEASRPVRFTEPGLYNFRTDGYQPHEGAVHVRRKARVRGPYTVHLQGTQKRTTKQTPKAGSATPSGELEIGVVWTATFRGVRPKVTRRSGVTSVLLSPHTQYGSMLATLSFRDTRSGEDAAPCAFGARTVDARASIFMSGMNYPRGRTGTWEVEARNAQADLLEATIRERARRLCPDRSLAPTALGEIITEPFRGGGLEWHLSPPNQGVRAVAKWRRGIARPLRALVGKRSFTIRSAHSLRRVNGREAGRTGGCPPAAEDGCVVDTASATIKGTFSR